MPAVLSRISARVWGSKVDQPVLQIQGISPDAVQPKKFHGKNADPLVGKIIDRYQVISLIDEGAMGTIYKVLHIHLNKYFAMKVIRDLPTTTTKEFFLRFQQEAKATSQLDHPHCVSTIDFGQTDAGTPYFVMELLEGVALSELLDKPVAISHALEIMRQSLLGIQYAHEAGVIHRDLKPANIMVTQAPKKGFEVKLIDFGLARRQQIDPTKKSIRRITQARIVCGTPAYMAPELIKGQEADQRSDLYSMGVILFLLLTGRRPFYGESSHNILKNKFFFPALYLDTVAPGVFSRPLRQLLDKALHREPEHRFASAEEFRLALQAVQKSRGGGLVTRRPFLMALAPSRIGRTLRSYYYQLSH